MSLSSTLTNIETWFKNEFTNDVEPALEAGEKVIINDLPAVGIAIAKAFLAALTGNLNFATIISTVDSILKTQGISIAKDAVIAVVNTAENELIAVGTPSVITTNAASNADATAPLDATHPAVAAATAVGITVAAEPAEEPVSTTVTDPTLDEGTK